MSADEELCRRDGSQSEHVVSAVSGGLDRRRQPVRVVDVFVDILDLATLGFEGVSREAAGRPFYHPGTLLKLYIYGYLNRVQSSRRLERDAGCNVEVMWLTKRLCPDHKTIAAPGSWLGPPGARMRTARQNN